MGRFIKIDPSGSFSPSQRGLLYHWDLFPRNIHGIVAWSNGSLPLVAIKLREKQMARVLLCSWRPFRGRWAIRRRTHPWDRYLSTGHGIRSVRESRGSERPFRWEAFSVDSWGTTIDRGWKTRAAILHVGVRERRTGKPEEGFRVSWMFLCFSQRPRYSCLSRF